MIERDAIPGELDARAADSRLLSLNTLALAIATVVGLALIWCFRNRGWYAHDEGTLGQSAVRVLAGQLPHRDFDDPYTGGLAILHALVFRIAGVNSNALRDHMALVSTVWFLGLFWLVTHWLRPVGAALVALIVVAFTIPVYPAPMPSWYILFLACAAAGVLVVGIAHPRRAAFGAGLIIGIAALIKVTAAYALAGALLGIIALRQQEDRSRRAAIEVIAGTVLFALLVVRLTGTWLTPRVLAHLTLPAAAVAIAIGWRELRHGLTHRFGIDIELWRRGLALVAGTAIPVALFAIWFQHEDALAGLLTALFQVVGHRTSSAAFPPPSVRSVLFGVGLLLVLVGGGRRLAIRPGMLVALGAAILLLAWVYPFVHADIWRAIRGVVPAGALLFAFAWSRDRDTPSSFAARGRAVFVPLTGTMALGQFPFAAPIYFVYVMPLLVVALSAAVALRSAATQRVAAVAAAFFLLFGLTQVVPGGLESLGVYADHHPETAWLTSPRGRLAIPPDMAELYQRLLAVLDSVPAGPIWAGPDAPEVSYLSGRTELNRSQFAFLGPENPAGPPLAGRMSARGAVAIVVDSEPAFSRRLAPATLDSIARYFPHRVSMERFTVYWREQNR
jgi:hypothetical protein